MTLSDIKTRLMEAEGASREQYEAVRERERKFWEKVDVRGPDECWEWTGTRYPAPRNYGFFYISKSNEQETFTLYIEEEGRRWSLI